jgi:8-oxo-dGTP diphosphatase
VTARDLQQFQVAIKAFILRDDQLLMVREAAGDKPWELPGGRIDVGEEALPPTDVLRRELAEELGPSFECDIVRPVVSWTRAPDPPRRANFVFLLAYLCHYRGGEIALSAEHEEFRWVTRAQCADLRLAPGYAAPIGQFWAALK